MYALFDFRLNFNVDGHFWTRTREFALDLEHPHSSSSFSSARLGFSFPLPPAIPNRTKDQRLHGAAKSMINSSSPSRPVFPHLPPSFNPDSISSTYLTPIFGVRIRARCSHCWSPVQVLRISVSSPLWGTRLCVTLETSPFGLLRPGPSFACQPSQNVVNLPS